MRKGKQKSKKEVSDLHEEQNCNIKNIDYPPKTLIIPNH